LESITNEVENAMIEAAQGNAGKAGKGHRLDPGTVDLENTKK